LQQEFCPEHPCPQSLQERVYHLHPEVEIPDKWVLSSTEISSIIPPLDLSVLTFSSFHAFLWVSGVYTKRSISEGSGEVPLRNKIDFMPKSKLTSLPAESSRSQEGTQSTTSFLSIKTDAWQRAWNKAEFDKLVNWKNNIVNYSYTI
jgi:hypothetical protein